MSGVPGRARTVHDPGGATDREVEEPAGSATLAAGATGRPRADEVDVGHASAAGHRNVTSGAPAATVAPASGTASPNAACRASVTS